MGWGSGGLFSPPLHPGMALFQRCAVHGPDVACSWGAGGCWCMVFPLSFVFIRKLYFLEPPILRLERMGTTRAHRQAYNRHNVESYTRLSQFASHYHNPTRTVAARVRTNSFTGNTRCSPRHEADAARQRRKHNRGRRTCWFTRN